MIVTYNRLELTKKTLDCLFENTDYPFDLVFVDNASTDGTVDYLYQFCGDNLLPSNGLFKGFKIQRNETNQGIAIGRNQALLLSEGEWLSTLDNDVLLPKGWLSESISILKKNPSYAMIGVNMEGVQYPLVSSGDLEWQIKPKGNLGTACTVFNRSLHKMLGFFNWKDYGRYGEEDADFGARVRVLGLKMGYIKEMGTHLGEGENDTGEYRKFKTEQHKNNLRKFNENCAAYFSKRKNLYISFK